MGMILLDNNNRQKEGELRGGELSTYNSTTIVKGGNPKLASSAPEKDVANATSASLYGKRSAKPMCVATCRTTVPRRRLPMSFN